MKRQDLKKSVLKAVDKMAKAEIEKNKFGWPPFCIGIYHQPKRPRE